MIHQQMEQDLPAAAAVKTEEATNAATMSQTQPTIPLTPQPATPQEEVRYLFENPKFLLKILQIIHLNPFLQYFDTDLLSESCHRSS